MIALQTWVPPRWLHPAVAFALTALLLAAFGYIYTPSLIIIWPAIAIATVVVSFISGSWNYGDTFGQQAFLGMMYFVMPPFAVAEWICDLQDHRKHNVVRAPESVPLGDIADVIGIAVFGTVVFVGASVGFFFVAFS